MGRLRKYCSAQPWYDYIGVPQRLRKEYDKENKPWSKYSENCIHRGEDFFCVLDGGYCPETQPKCPNFRKQKSGVGKEKEGK